LQTDVFRKSSFSLKSLRTESLRDTIFVLGRRRRRFSRIDGERESQQLATGNAHSAVLKKLALDARAEFTRRAVARVMERNVRRMTNVWVIDSMTL